MVMFSGSELVQVAINIERNGIAFYNTLAERAQDAQTRETFQGLARMEEEHEKTFQAMLESVGKYEPFEAYAEEHALYLRALANSAIFSDAGMAAEMARDTTGPAEVLQLGVSAEKDSILFYTEMRRVVKEPESTAIERIIKEEKSHLWQLLEMRKQAGEDWATR